MADRGAKNLILLSRSGGDSSPQAAQLISDLRNKGVTVAAPRCNVASASSLEAAMAECRGAGMPAIKGCMNLAMVLQDAIFENMTYDQWTTTVRTKVESSRNLHSLLPRDMDFFVMLSSLAGIYGSPSQSNYNAGNAFQDELCRMRSSLLPSCTSVSLDLGWMWNIGIVAEREDYRRVRENVKDMVPIRTGDMLALLEYYCDPSLTMPESQLLVGMTTPADFHSRGDPVPAHLVGRPLFAPFESAHAASRVKLKSGSSGDPSNSHQQEASSRSGQSKKVLDKIVADALSPSAQGSQRADLIATALCNKLARSLGLDSGDEVSADRSLADYGVDSLMAVELRNWLWGAFGASVAVFELMGPAIGGQQANGSGTTKDITIRGLGYLVAGRIQASN